MHAMAGISFGAIEYILLQFSVTNAFVAGFMVPWLGALIFLAAKKSRLVRTDEAMFALARPYRHIFADWLFTCSSVATFSLLVYLIVNHAEVIDQHANLSFGMMLLLVDMAMFIGATYLFSMLAKEERQLLERGRR